MTKYKKLDPNGRSAECWYIFIDKEILDKNDVPYESLNSDLLKKLPKNKYIEYVSPSYLGEILFTNEYSNGDIYCSKSDVIEELFISINNGNLEIDNNLFKNFEDILKISLYLLFFRLSQSKIPLFYFQTQFWFSYHQDLSQDKHL